MTACDDKRCAVSEASEIRSNGKQKPYISRQLNSVFIHRIQATSTYYSISKGEILKHTFKRHF